MIPGPFPWDDIGTWEALTRVREADAHGNVLVGPVHAVDSASNVAWSEGAPIVLSGVKDLVVVHANGRHAGAGRDHAGDMKRTLEALPPNVRDLPMTCDCTCSNPTRRDRPGLPSRASGRSPSCAPAPG